MRIHVTSLIIMLMPLASRSVYADPCADPSFETVLDAIAYVESRSGSLPPRDLYPHKDARSWGVYGLTQAAVDDLAMHNLLPRGSMVADVAGRHVPHDQQRALAANYLRLCLRYAQDEHCYGSHANWLHAAGVYHAGMSDKAAPQRLQYIRALRRYIENAHLCNFTVTCL